MIDQIFGNTKNVYFVGIGGIGMSGIAEVLINLGFKVSGSDRQLTDITENLKSLGATIYDGHDAANVKDIDVVVISSAVKQDNPEVQAAHRQNIPVIRRAEMLGELMRMKKGIAIAGTHGKTTTTSITGLVLEEGGFDPTLIVGGKLRALKTNAKLGTSDVMVVEADEFDRSFLKLTPTLAVITNLETDHLDCYENLDDIKNAFIEFANKVPFYGAVILCLDEKGLQSIMPYLERRVITYGFTPQAEIRAENVRFNNALTQFTAIAHGKNLGEIVLHLPGEHNIKNALAAIGVGVELNIPFKKIKKAIESFKGVYRRFEIKDNVNDILVVDDYAHHPTEIQASLKGARNGWNRRIVAVFQPHLFSRTRDFYHEFGQSFFDADVLIVTDIYPAREEPIPGITGELVAEEARKMGHREVIYIPDKNNVLDYLSRNTKANDMIVTLGAGDIYRVGEKFIELYKS